MLLRLSIAIGTFFYDVKNLRYFKWASILLSSFLFLIGCLSLMMNYIYLNAMYGIVYMILGFIPYLLFGVLTIFYQLLKGHNGRLPLILSLVFIPSGFLTQDGVAAAMFFGMALVVMYLERSHRQEVVRIVSMFSEAYSPLYKERLKNKVAYREYAKAYRLLELFDPKDFNLLSEDITTHRDFRGGLSYKELVRTFSIKGVPGKTKVVDHMLSSPQKRSRFGKVRI